MSIYSFIRGIGGCPQQAVFVVTEWAIANDVTSKASACQTKKLLVIGEKLLTNKEIMIATSVAIGAGFNLD